MKQAIRHFIIVKARELFEKNGFNNTTMEGIAQAADVSKPTVYKYFTSKEVLLLHVVDHMNTEMEEILHPIFSSTGPFVSRLRELIEKLMRHIHDNRGIFRLAVAETRIILQALGEDHRGIDDFIDKRQKRIRNLEEFFATGIREGAVRKQYKPEFLAHFFMGSLNEYHLGLLLNDGGDSEPDLARLSDYIVTLMTDGFINPEYRIENKKQKMS